MPSGKGHPNLTILISFGELMTVASIISYWLLYNLFFFLILNSFLMWFHFCAYLCLRARSTSHTHTHPNLPLTAKVKANEEYKEWIKRKKWNETESAPNICWFRHRVTCTMCTLYMFLFPVEVFFSLVPLSNSLLLFHSWFFDVWNDFTDSISRLLFRLPHFTLYMLHSICTMYA